MVNSICVSLSIYRYIIYFNIYDVLYMYACGIYGTTRYALEMVGGRKSLMLCLWCVGIGRNVPIPRNSEL